jgi:hypothetical protein
MTGAVIPAELDYECADGVATPPSGESVTKMSSPENSH